MSASTDRILITGATSQIGVFLAPLLADAGFEVHAMSRTSESVRRLSHRRRTLGLPSPETFHIGDFAEPPDLDFPVQGLIHCAGIWDLPGLLEATLGRNLLRVVAFSSTSVEAKSDSGSRAEQRTVEKLRDGESVARAVCSRRRIALTILRPTMIYGCGMDRNVVAIARLVQRFHFFPSFGGGRGLRQPVHAADLALAAVKALSMPVSLDRTYNLSGESISYRDMVTEIFRVLEMKPRFLNIPVSLVRTLAAAVHALGFALSPDMIDRVNRDLVFDSSDARKDLDFKPRPFQPSRFELGVGNHLSAYPR